VISNCFGYSVDVLDTSISGVANVDRYRLQPTCIPRKSSIDSDKNNFFLVEFNRAEGTIMLIETPFTSRWTLELNEYLSGMNSYPAFFHPLYFLLSLSHKGDGQDSKLYK